jgi:hypothetical protein
LTTINVETNHGTVAPHGNSQCNRGIRPRERKPMNQDIFAGQWKQMRGELKAWWGKLADDDFERIGGRTN